MVSISTNTSLDEYNTSLDDCNTLLDEYNTSLDDCNTSLDEYNISLDVCNTSLDKIPRAVGLMIDNFETNGYSHRHVDGGT